MRTRRFLLIAAFPAMLSHPVSAAGTEPASASRAAKLSAVEMFALADAALRRGDAPTAEAVYAALAGDAGPDIRAEARFRHARLLSQLNRTRQAATLLRQILDEKPNAGPVRLELAQLLDRMGDKEAAWRQMRAMQAGGLPPAVARLVDRYSEALRAFRPSGTNLEIAIAPESNINRATRSPTLSTILGDFDIGEEGKARSGTGVSANGHTYRRLPLGGSGSSLLMRGGASADLYRHKQFNDIAVDLAAGPELKLGRGRVQLEGGVSQRWFGQKPFLRSARLAAAWTSPVGPRTQLRLSGSAALLDNRLNDLQDGKVYSAQFSAEHALTPAIGLVAGLGIDRQSLADPGYSTTGWQAGLTAWSDIGRMTVTAGADLRRLRADDRLMLFPDERSDRSLRLSLGATFRQLQVAGFAPVARLIVEHNSSSIAFYDYRRTRTEFGIVRAF